MHQSIQDETDVWRSAQSMPEATLVYRHMSELSMF
jgi:hypothetical protein